VPTARETWHNDPESAKRAAATLGAPLVVKATGLAAGKGVAVVEQNADPYTAIDDIFRLTTELGNTPEVLIEEFMTGEEISVFAVSDGTNFVILPASQDHKRLLEGDKGPNTGGMGAYAPISLATHELLGQVSEKIFRPVLQGMKDEGSPFMGLLYAGLMLTPTGPKVVEFNCRFGDPETQVVLPLLKSGLRELLLNASHPGGLAGAAIPQVHNRTALTTVVATRGYPARAEIGDPITLPHVDSSDVMIFHAGTRMLNGGLVTAGGRVFAVTGVGDSLDEARRASQGVAESIQFDGKHWRRDIGYREIDRRG
jgi:phosphoribosylamine---glycine ligase